MFKSCANLVNNVWVKCDSFCVKKWVDFVNKFNVGKTNNFFTFQPTFFQQAFSTHSPLLKTYNSPVSTTPITTTKYIKENK